VGDRQELIRVALSQ